MNTFNRIVQECSEKLITLNDLEKKCCIPQNTIIKWENEEPNYFYLLLIAAVLKISPYWLETGKIIKDIYPLEENIIYILRHLDKEGVEKIYSPAWKELEKLYVKKQ